MRDRARRITLVCFAIAAGGVLLGLSDAMWWRLAVSIPMIVAVAVAFAMIRRLFDEVQRELQQEHDDMYDHGRIKEKLIEIDEADIELSQWEISFIGGLIGQDAKWFSPAQASKIEDIYERLE